MTSPTVLVGRHREQSIIKSSLAGARQGTSSVLVFEGDPGIGKSALLADTRAAAPDIVLTTVGVEGESDIAYVNLADVFRPYYARLSTLPERQADALFSVFAIGPSKPADRLSVGAATLNLMSSIAADGPVLVTIDDAQWVDPSSLDALMFAANRLEAEGVVLVFAVRSGNAVASRLGRFPSLRLDGLDHAAARSLVAASSLPTMSDASAARLVQESGGNPLALLTLPATMNSDEVALWALSEEPLPMSSVLEGAFSETFRVLPAPTRRALLLLAVMGSTASGYFEDALAADGLGLADLDLAEEAGLLVVRRSGPEFRHPLMRAAAYRASSAVGRRSAHLLAAQMLEAATSAISLERRAWHLVAAGTAADETIAQTFQTAADGEFVAANFTAAGKLYKRSSELTPVPDTAMRRMLQAANALRLAGAIDETQTLLRDAGTLGTAPELVAAIGYAQQRLEVWRGVMPEGRDGLVAVATAAAAAQHSAQAAEILSDAALASVVVGDLARARAMAVQATDLAGAPGSDPPLTTAAVNAMVAALSGDVTEARRLLVHRADEIDAVDPLGIDFGYQVPLEVSIAHLAVEEADRARAVLVAAIAGARQRSATGVLPFRLGSLARIEFWQGRWASALGTVHETLQLVDDTGWVSERPSSLATLARITALTGQPEKSRAYAEEAAAGAAQIGAGIYLRLAEIALGLLELTAGRPALAIPHFVQVSAFADEAGFSNSPILWWSADLIECFVLEGMQDEARHELERLERVASQPRMPTTAAVTARSRALLEPTAFEEHMTEALRWHALGDMPFEQARSELMIGQFLRRHHQPTKARPLLRAALATFDRLGAVDWGNRAKGELEATGVRMPHRDVGLAELTPQELQVALAAAAGRSNREIAGQLFLSTKTVEFHLRNVFNKLGINRRTRLAAIVARQETRGAPSS